MTRDDASEKLKEFKLKIWRDKIKGFDQYSADELFDLACEAETSMRSVGPFDQAFGYFSSQAHAFSEAAYFKASLT